MVLFRELGFSPEPGRNDNDSLMIARTHVVATRFDSSFQQGENDFVLSDHKYKCPGEWNNRDFTRIE